MPGEDASPSPAPSPADAGTPPKPGKPADGGSGALTRIAFPRHVTGMTWIGIGIGLALIVLGYVSSNYALWKSQSNLVTAIGAGVLLAAFGGQASARFGPFVLAGAVAITAFFVWFLNSSDDTAQERRSYFVGTIRDVDPKLYSVSLRNKGSAYSRLEAKDYNFVAPRAEFDEGAARIEFEVKDRNRVPYCRDRPADEDCIVTFDIPSDIFGDAAGQNRTLQWRLDTGEMQLYDIVTKKKLQDTQVAQAPARGPLQAGLAALATTMSLQAQAQGTQSPEELKAALDDLTSEDIDARRVARDALSNGPVSWVRPIADRLLADYDVYRIRLGCSVALAQMLRQNKKAAADIQAQLTPAHLDALLRATGDDDRTVRIYAGEFLFDLGDPRTVTLALALAEQSAQDNALFNYVLVVKGAIAALPPADRQAALTRLQALARLPKVGPKTQDQIGQAIKQGG